MFACSAPQDRLLFTITDYMARGLCCAGECGHFRITVDGSTVARSGHRTTRTGFTRVDTRTFSLWGGRPVPVPGPDAAVCAPIAVTVVADGTPAQNAWRVTRPADGAVLLAAAVRVPRGPNTNATLYCGTPGQELLFTLHDWGWDGLGAGASYSVVVNGTEVLQGQYFQRSASRSFVFLPRAAPGRPQVAPVPFTARVVAAPGTPLDSAEVRVPLVASGPGGTAAVEAVVAVPRACAAQVSPSATPTAPPLAPPSFHLRLRDGYLGVMPKTTPAALEVGSSRCGAVRCGAVRCGAVRCGAVRCGAVRCGAVRCVLLPPEASRLSACFRSARDCLPLVTCPLLRRLAPSPCRLPAHGSTHGALKGMQPSSPPPSPGCGSPMSRVCAELLR